MKKNNLANQPLQLLGGISVRKFLSTYWQKKPLLIRQAIPGFTGVTGLSSRQEMLQWVCEDEVESRLIEQVKGAWKLTRSPLTKNVQKRARTSPWTVLLQGVNTLLPEGDALMRQFNFIPSTRLDDLMVSYATDGGSVGPHFDSYDVFLLQGMGKRHWQISAQKDLDIIEGAPLRILKQFKTQHEWVLEPGDMLYLPPKYAHHGVAQGECMTFSIGFRAPAYEEIASHFLNHIQDNLCIEGRYADPDLSAQKHPAEISADMLDKVEQVLKKIQWKRADVAEFIGCYLTEPKTHIFFDAPEQPLSPARFRQKIGKTGIKLDLRTQMLFHKDCVFLNGEPYVATRDDLAWLKALADHRMLPSLKPSSDAAEAVLYEWYCDGFLHP